MSDETTTTSATSPTQGGHGGRVYRRQYEAATSIADFQLNKQVVEANIAAAALRAGRNPADIRMLAVSKTVPEERLRAAYAAGLNTMAENKVQEAHAKWESMSDLDVRWTMIGHLQTNKAKVVAEFAHEFQALDSLKLAAALDRKLQQMGRSMHVLVQVNVSGEDTKSGITGAEVNEFVRELHAFDSLKVRGLMTIASNTTNEQQVRACFHALKELRDQARDQAPDSAAFTELSMGMSGDYEIAIEEGATVVRVGSALFGSRYYPA